MAKKLQFEDFEPLSKSQMQELGLKGRQYISPSTGQIIPVSRFQKLAHEVAGTVAPSRAAKLDHPVSTILHVTEQPKVSQTLRNRRAFAETYGMSLREASRDTTLRYYNNLWKKDLERLEKMVEARGKSKEQTPAEIELRKSLSDTAKEIGRKKQDDYRDFGQTDRI